MRGLKLAIYGTGGLGRSTYSWLERGAIERLELLDQICFLSDSGNFVCSWGDNKVLSIDDLKKLNLHPDFAVVVAIGDGKTRRAIVGRVAEAGFKLTSVISPTSLIDRGAKLGRGSIVGDLCFVSANVICGESLVMGVHSCIEHDCVVGDFVTLGPGAHLNGNVHLEDNVMIGAGAFIINGYPEKPLVIGKNSVVGLGAVVINDVEEATTVVGNPARPVT